MRVLVSLDCVALSVCLSEPARCLQRSLPSRNSRKIISSAIMSVRAHKTNRRETEGGRQREGQGPEVRKLPCRGVGEPHGEWIRLDPACGAWQGQEREPEQAAVHPQGPTGRWEPGLPGRKLHPHPDGWEGDRGPDRQGGCGGNAGTEARVQNEVAGAQPRVSGPSYGLRAGGPTPYGGAIRALTRTIRRLA